MARFKKGSAAAKRFMASIRPKRHKRRKHSAPRKRKHRFRRLHRIFRKSRKVHRRARRVKHHKTSTAQLPIADLAVLGIAGGMLAGIGNFSTTSGGGGTGSTPTNGSVTIQASISNANTYSITVSGNVVNPSDGSVSNATLDFGDGSTDELGFNLNTGFYTTGHTYSTFGTYNVIVSVTFTDSTTATASSSVSLIYIGTTNYDSQYSTLITGILNQLTALNKVSVWESSQTQAFLLQEQNALGANETLANYNSIVAATNAYFAPYLSSGAGASSMSASQSTAGLVITGSGFTPNTTIYLFIDQASSYNDPSRQNVGQATVTTSSTGAFSITQGGAYGKNVSYVVIALQSPQSGITSGLLAYTSPVTWT